MVFSVSKLFSPLIFLLTFTENFSQKLLFSESQGNGFHTPTKEFFNRCPATLDTVKKLWESQIWNSQIYLEKQGGGGFTELRSLFWGARMRIASSFELGYKDSDGKNNWG